MKKNASTIILILVFFAGLCILLYPGVSDYVNSKHSTKAIVNYEEALSSLTPKDYTKEFAAADEYNKKISTVTAPFVLHDKVPGYEECLDVTGTGIMGYVTIDKIKVSLPVYHGISAPVLNIAVGHVPGSSLPAGGPGTHCVLSAHRGLPSAKLFSNLDKLSEGDLFSIMILDRVLTYEVDQILIVKPDQVDELAIKEGEDLCTLVTCTPYGINTHRLLVRGHRTETPEALPEIRVFADAVRIDQLLIAPAAAAPMLLILLMALLLKSGRTKD